MNSESQLSVEQVPEMQIEPRTAGNVLLFQRPGNFADPGDVDRL
ncbi:hypothetical protein [Viridibacillus arvi]|nr:hypothetical protein [Viridibacillus arvi]